MTTIRKNYNELDITPDHFTILWKDEPFTGIGYDLTPDGNLWSEQAYVNGLRDGVGRAWSLAGILIIEDYSSHNNLHGSRYEWFENGQLKIEAAYEFGIPVYRQEWDSDGNLIRSFQLKETDRDYARLLRYSEIYKDWGEAIYEKPS